MDMQFLLQLVEQVKRILGLAVHLIDKDDDGRIPHAAHLHQFACLRLHTLSSIHHDDDAIHSGQRAVGILSKVLVAWGVEDIDFIVMVVKLHHRRSHRDSTLLLDVHPVRSSCFLDFVALHRASHLNLSAKEEQFLRKRSLTSIRVCDNRKSTSSIYFSIHYYKRCYD